MSSVTETVNQEDIIIPDDRQRSVRHDEALGELIESIAETGH